MPPVTEFTGCYYSKSVSPAKWNILIKTFTYYPLRTLSHWGQKVGQPIANILTFNVRALKLIPCCCKLWCVSMQFGFLCSLKHPSCHFFTHLVLFALPRAKTSERWTLSISIFALTGWPAIQSNAQRDTGKYKWDRKGMSVKVACCASQLTCLLLCQLTAVKYWYFLIFPWKRQAAGFDLISHLI